MPAEIADVHHGMAVTLPNGFALVVLDLAHVAGDDAAAFCQAARATGTLVVLAARRATEDAAIAALEAYAADDLIWVDDNPQVLAHKMRAMLRRHSHRPPRPSGDRPMRKVEGDIIVDRAANELRVGARSVRLNVSTAQVLRILAAAPGRLIARDEIGLEAFGEAWEQGSRRVDVAVQSARVALAECGVDCMISSVRGTGYRLDLMAKAA
jgi:two-component system phosphate regulon response regulator OmpR